MNHQGCHPKTHQKTRILNQSFGLLKKKPSKNIHWFVKPWNRPWFHFRKWLPTTICAPWFKRQWETQVRNERIRRWTAHIKLMYVFWFVRWSWVFCCSLLFLCCTWSRDWLDAAQATLGSFASQTVKVLLVCLLPAKIWTCPPYAYGS